MVLVVRSVRPVCPENEVRATPIGIVDTSGGFAGLVLTCRIILLYQDTESDRCVLGGGLFLR